MLLVQNACWCVRVLWRQHTGVCIHKHRKRVLCCCYFNLEVHRLLCWCPINHRTEALSEILLENLTRSMGKNCRQVFCILAKLLNACSWNEKHDRKVTSTPLWQKSKIKGLHVLSFWLFDWTGNLFKLSWCLPSPSWNDSRCKTVTNIYYLTTNWVFDLKFVST